MRLGNADILQVRDGAITIAAPPNLPPPGSDAYAGVRDHVQDDGRFSIDLGGFVVRMGGHTVLVDTGLGAGRFYRPGDNPGRLDAFIDSFRREGISERQLASRRARFEQQSTDRGHLPESLARIGLTPGDITDVVLTHLHHDHLGWVSHEQAPFFSRATYWCSAADAEHFLGPDAVETLNASTLYDAMPTKERMAPVQPRLRTWDRDGTILPGIDARLAPGHTPGSTIIVVSSGDERAMIVGDVVHCPLELMDEDFAVFRDIDPVLARRSREALVREIEDGTVHVASPHFPGLQFGRLFRGEGKRTWSWSG